MARKGSRSMTVDTALEIDMVRLSTGKGSISRDYQIVYAVKFGIVPFKVRQVALLLGDVVVKLCDAVLRVLGHAVGSFSC